VCPDGVLLFKEDPYAIIVWCSSSSNSSSSIHRVLLSQPQHYLLIKKAINFFGRVRREGRERRERKERETLSLTGGRRRRVRRPLL